MNSNHKPNIGERYISYILKQAQRYPSAPMLSLLATTFFAISTIMSWGYRIEVPISLFGLLASLFVALLWYERLQFSRMILERDNKIAQLVRQ